MDDLRSRLEQQSDELELLQSMFSAPGEFQIDDQTSYDQVSSFLRSLTPDTPGRLSCSLHIPIEAHHHHDAAGQGTATRHTVDVFIRLPHSYPDTPPEVYVSCNDLKRSSQDDLNAGLHDYIHTSITPGDVCLLSLLEWIRDNAQSYIPIPGLIPEPEAPPTHFCRMWLYMHHIYSKTKRKDILSLAPELGLTGFTLPGKPGVVCVEGEEGKTREFYSILRRWNWKSITCRKKETVPDSDIASQRKIVGFQELVFDTHGQRQDLGQFLEYLRQHGLEYMFKVLFGIEGHSADSTCVGNNQ